MDVPGTVGEILDRKRPEVWSVAPDTTVYQAIQLMADKNVGALPVLDNNRLVGMISERDYTRKVQFVNISQTLATSRRSLHPRERFRADDSNPRFNRDCSRLRERAMDTGGHARSL